MGLENNYMGVNCGLAATLSENGSKLRKIKNV